MKSVLALLSLVLLLQSCAMIKKPDTDQAYSQASLANTASTGAVLLSGLGKTVSTLNLASTAMIKSAIYMAKQETNRIGKANWNKIGNSTFGGAAINNVLALAGASPMCAVGGGLASAAWLYTRPTKISNSGPSCGLSDDSNPSETGVFTANELRIANSQLATRQDTPVITSREECLEPITMSEHSNVTPSFTQADSVFSDNDLNIAKAQGVWPQ